MFLHLKVPGFYAAVHQAQAPVLAGRPLAVAVATTPETTLVGISAQARLQGVRTGMTVGQALRRSPGLEIVPPAPGLYRRAHRRLVEICRRWTSRVGGTCGRLDLDLPDGMAEERPREGVQGRVREEGSVREGMIQTARGLRQACLEELGLRPGIGVARRLLVARLVAGMACADCLVGRGLVVVEPGMEDAVIDPMAVERLWECDSRAKGILARCGITTIAHLRTCSADDLIGLLGQAGSALYNRLHGLGAEQIVSQAEDEPSVTASAACVGSGPETGNVVGGLAGIIGRILAERHLACTRLTLEGSDGEQAGHRLEVVPGTTLQGAQDILEASLALLERLRPRLVRLRRVRLTGSGLCARR